MTLALLIYCYANGVFGSRRIEAATYRAIAVRYLCADTHPDHMARQLQAEGYDVRPYRARSLMRKAGVEVRRKKRFKATTDSRHRNPVAQNLLNRQFAIQAPNQAWCADIT